MNMYEILADVSIDIDQTYAKENDIKYIPMDYMIGTETRNCAEPENDEMMHQYYDQLRGKVPTRTSQITPYHYVEAFTPYVKAQKPLIYICLSSGLSNTYESARMAVTMLEDEYDSVQIEVVDSLGATGGMGLLTESAVENRKKGMSLTENAEWLREHAKKINYWFMVQDLMYLMRGGRLSAASAIMGTALNIKPILTIRPDGKLDTVSKKRGAKLAMKEMLSRFEANYDPSVSKTIYISCADCMDDARKLKAAVLESHPDATVRLTMLSPIIGAHTGPDMFALIYYGKDRI